MSLCEYPSKIGGMQVEQLICLEIVSLRSIRESSMLSHGQCLVQPSIKSMFQMLTLEVVFNNIKNLTHHKSLGIPCYVFFSADCIKTLSCIDKKCGTMGEVGDYCVDFPDCRLLSDY